MFGWGANDGSYEGVFIEQKGTKKNVYLLGQLRVIMKFMFMPVH